MDVYVIIRYSGYFGGKTITNRHLYKNCTNEQQAYQKTYRLFHKWRKNVHHAMILQKITTKII